MKKLFIILCCSICMANVYADVEDEISQCVILNVTYEDPLTLNNPFPRTPAYRPTATLEDGIITFNAFNRSGIFEVVNPETEAVLYSQPFAATDTECQLPTTLEEGEYIIRFVFENYMYWGYIIL